MFLSKTSPFLDAIDFGGSVNGPFHPGCPHLDFWALFGNALDKLGQLVGELLPSWRQFGIASDTTVNIVVGLAYNDENKTISHQIKCHLWHHFTVSSQVNCPGCYVAVHHVVDDPALNVAFVLVRQDFGAGVVHLEEAVLGLVSLVNLLVLRLVVADPLFEVFNHLVRAGKWTTL